jgi:multisubunit Na+/H+ antiporter MnhE subunit
VVVRSSGIYKSIFDLLATWATLFGVYLLLVGNAALSELAVGAVLGLAVTVLLLWSKSAGMLPFRFRWWFVAPLRYLPGAILWETGQDLYALARRLAGQDVQGVTLRVPFAYTGRDAESATRRAIAIFGVTITPNSYVVRIDVDKKEILIRQLVGRELSKSDSEFLRVG